MGLQEFFLCYQSHAEVSLTFGTKTSQVRPTKAQKKAGKLSRVPNCGLERKERRKTPLLALCARQMRFSYKRLSFRTWTERVPPWAEKKEPSFQLIITILQPGCHKTGFKTPWKGPKFFETAFG